MSKTDGLDLGGCVDAKQCNNKLVHASRHNKNDITMLYESLTLVEGKTEKPVKQ